MENSAITVQTPENVVFKGSVTPSLLLAPDYGQIIEVFKNNIRAAQSSREFYGRALKQFFEWVQMTGRVLADLTQEDILRYMDYLYPEAEEDRKVTTLTAGSYLVAVRKFYELLESRKLYPNITKGIAAPKKENTYQKQYLHVDEIENLLNYYTTRSLRDYAIVNLCVRTGLRTIEVIRANVGNIDIKNGKRILKVWGKGHKEADRYVVLTDKAYNPIREYLDKCRPGAKDNEPLFTSNSHQNYGQRLTTKTISSICKDGLRAIGLDSRSYTAHSLRHTAASQILDAGGSLFDVQKVLRHSSVETSQIYVKMKEEERRLQTPPEELLDRMF